MAEKENTNEARLKALEEITAGQEETIEALRKENAKLAEQVGAVSTGTKKRKEKPKPPTKTFTVSGTKYRFQVVQFRYDRQVVKAVDALEDKELLKELVANNSRVITQES